MGQPPHVWEKVGGRKWSTSDGISFWYLKKKRNGTRSKKNKKRTTEYNKSCHKTCLWPSCVFFLRFLPAVDKLTSNLGKIKSTIFVSIFYLLIFLRVYVCLWLPSIRAMNSIFPFLKTKNKKTKKYDIDTHFPFFFLFLLNFLLLGSTKVGPPLPK